MSIRAVIRNCIIYFYYEGSYIPCILLGSRWLSLVFNDFFALAYQKKKKKKNLFKTVFEFNYVHNINIMRFLVNRSNFLLARFLFYFSNKSVSLSQKT